MQQPQDMTQQEEQTPLLKPHIPNASRLAYQRIYYQQGPQLVVQELGGWEQASALQQYYTYKDLHQKGVRRFKNVYGENENGRRKRFMSTDTEKNGAYHLNNWISSDQYLCEKPTQDKKQACLLYDLLALKWSRALEWLAQLPKTSETATLQLLIGGYKALSDVLAEDDHSVGDYFFEREMFQVRARASQTGGYISLLEEEGRRKYSEVEQLPARIQIMKENIEFISRFAATYVPQTSNPYIYFAFKYLANDTDQWEEELDPQQDFFKLLLNLDFPLSDRLNFVTRLLPQSKRPSFCLYLQDRLCIYPRLDNILFYSVGSMTPDKQARIERICRSYIDEYCDLQTIAYMHYEFPFLRRYYLEYRYNLESVGDSKQLQRLENYRWRAVSEGYKPHPDPTRPDQSFLRYPQLSQTSSFYEYVNISQERVQQWKTLHSQRKPVCQICARRLSGVQSFIQCQKCRHGGHVGHMLRWFGQYECCPHVGCPCLCN